MCAAHSCQPGRDAVLLKERNHAQLFEKLSSWIATSEAALIARAPKVTSVLDARTGLSLLAAFVKEKDSFAATNVVRLHDRVR